jgi:hypothetical protein
MNFGSHKRRGTFRLINELSGSKGLYCMEFCDYLRSSLAEKLLGEHLLRLCGLVVRVLGIRSEMYCASSEVRTEFIYVM